MTQCDLTFVCATYTAGKKPGLSGNGGGGGKKGERKKPIDTSARRRLSKGALRGGKVVFIESAEVFEIHIKYLYCTQARVYNCA